LHERAIQERKLKILVELRPALEGHAGIPQEARLLFRGLGKISGFEVQGLIQSSDRFLARGLPLPPGFDNQILPANEQVDRLSRVVVSIQPVIASRRPVTKIIDKILRGGRFAALLIRSVLRWPDKLGWFDPAQFHDFIWRSLFAKTLPVEDFDQVTRANYRVAESAYGAMHACGLLTRRFGRAVYPSLDTRGIDAMLVLTPYPATVTVGTKLIVRYFDAVPLLMSHTIIHKARHQALHYQALRNNVVNGAYFACCSDATRNDLLAAFPEARSRAFTIPCMLSHHYFKEESLSSRIPEILAKRVNTLLHKASAVSALGRSLDGPSVDYLLMVSTLEPRKNHLTLVDAWELLRRDTYRELKLVLVGALGWDHEAIVERMQVWIDRGDILILAGVPADELRVLYRHARATVCPSYAEGFGYAGVEAMRCGGVVVASDIHVHREVYKDAAEYCNPYSAADMAGAISRVIDPDRSQCRDRLVDRADQVCERYLPDEVLPQWEKLFGVREGMHSN
jgi:glycosyltransferase involved in cell wall biosynthesis